VVAKERDRDRRKVQESPSLPASRSFVVQFTADTAPASRRFRGRIEHIESARSRRFASLEDLAAFVADVLALETADEPD
jgi:hypothetical protein